MAIHSWRVWSSGWIDTFNIVKRCLVRTSEQCWQLCETLKIWEQNIEVTPGQSGVKSLAFTPAWPKSEVIRCGKSSPGLIFVIMDYASNGSTMTCFPKAHWSLYRNIIHTFCVVGRVCGCFFFLPVVNQWTPHQARQSKLCKNQRGPDSVIQSACIAAFCSAVTGVDASQGFVPGKGKTRQDRRYRAQPRLRLWAM